MLQKLIKFVKNNLAAVLGIAAIVLVCLLMLLPGQFANLQPVAKEEVTQLNGYEFFFNTKYIKGVEYHPSFFITQQGIQLNEAMVLPAAVIIFVLMLLTIVSYTFSKKSSSLLLLGGILEIATSVFYFAMEANAINKYGLRWMKDTISKDTYYGVIGWVSYVSGALLLLAGVYALVKSIKIMREEIKRPQVNKGPTYNYLKK